MAAEKRPMDMEEEEFEKDISDSVTLDKYKTAAAICTRAVQEVIKALVPGKRIVEVCEIGDNYIMDSLKTVFTKAERGIAFPTCVSPNNMAGHNSPLADDTTVVAEGDVMKIDLGVHIDGYIANVAHTVVVTSNPAEPITGRKADVIIAANLAAEAALRLIRVGGKNTEVTEVINKVAEAFKTSPCEGVLSHQLKRFVIDGSKVILQKPTAEQKVEEFTFEANEVYSLDIVFSTGEGKTRETESRTTVYKRALENSYSLKMQASRTVFTEINRKFPSLPFTLRALEDKRARLGMSEIIKHDLVHSYPVLYERAGEIVAQFKYTVLCTPTQTVKASGLPLTQVFKSEHSIQDPAVNELLAQPLGKKAKKTTKKTEGAEASMDTA